MYIRHINIEDTVQRLNRLELDLHEVWNHTRQQLGKEEHVNAGDATLANVHAKQAMDAVSKAKAELDHMAWQLRCMEKRVGK